MSKVRSFHLVWRCRVLVGYGDQSVPEPLGEPLLSIRDVIKVHKERSTSITLSRYLARVYS